MKHHFPILLQKPSLNLSSKILQPWWFCFKVQYKEFFARVNLGQQTPKYLGLEVWR
jgi:hypothetical protein